MRGPVALYDACVLYPAPLRDLLLRLAMTGQFRAVWTDAIHEEWMRAVLASRPDLARPQLERTRDLMNAHVLDSLVEGYESRIPVLKLPDPDDRHVLAAAIHAGAGVIVTFNLKDFPASALDQFKIVAQHPDDFVAGWCDAALHSVVSTAQDQLRSLKNPPKTAAELLQTFARVGLTKAAEILREHLS